MNAISQRLDERLRDCASSADIARVEQRMSERMSETKVEILRWSFVFWIGQVATIAVLLSYMLT